MKAESPHTAREEARFVVGIDLGTTNCAMAFAEPSAGRTIRDFLIDQFTAAGVRERRDILPSFIFTPPGETEPVVGIYARDAGALSPGRLVSSAKSWLCHARVDRESPILPWHADDDVRLISPVEAQSLILRHLRTAWDADHPDAPLADQEVFVTIPASFDEAARELTVKAARMAGLTAVILLEEPQAAFYAWLARHEKDWARLVGPDDLVLVCDVGGGTTDFTLIQARRRDDGQIFFHRVAVGEHLILGGDNLDLTLARHLEPRLTGGGKLNAREWATWVRLCRQFKEILLSANAPETLTAVLPGSGSSILGGHRQTMVERGEVEHLLVEGFLPLVPLDAQPAKRASGFQEFGLPFAPDPAISRYLSAFLTAHLPKRADGSFEPPKAVLLNGGLFESVRMRDRVMELLRGWFPEKPPILLENARLDLAVARGAAYYGLARRGLGIRVASPLARAYYIGVETCSLAGAPAALCLAPAGLAPGKRIQLDRHPLRARLKTPVSFPMYVSSVRTTDEAGVLVQVDPDAFKAIPPVQTVLATGKGAIHDVVEVMLSVELTEIGTLDLRIHERHGQRSWKLAFDLRGATRADLSFHDGRGERQGIIDEATIRQAAEVLERYFKRSAVDVAQHSPARELEVLLDGHRLRWPAPLLRALWDVLRSMEETRRLSASHEQRWLNLSGFCLRPGFGVALDDWRVGEMWKLFAQGPRHASDEAVRSEWWIFWRRLAGGLTAGQQNALAQPLLAAVRPVVTGKGRGKLPGGRELRGVEHEWVEILRLLGSLERLSRTVREELGDLLLERLRKKGADADRGATLWALGRIGAREPMYGEIQTIPSPETVGGWIRALTALQPCGDSKDLAYALVLLARLTGDRHRDVDDAVRAVALDWLARAEAPEHWRELVEKGGQLAEDEAARSLGDALPHGLSLA